MTRKVEQINTFTYSNIKSFYHDCREHLFIMAVVKPLENGPKIAPKIYNTHC